MSFKFQKNIQKNLFKTKKFLQLTLHEFRNEIDLFQNVAVTDA